MNKKVIKNEHTFLVDLDSGKKSTFVSAMFDLSSQAEMLVDEAFASDRPILMILPSESKQTNSKSVFKPRFQNDFSTLMRQVEKEVYG